MRQEAEGLKHYILDKSYLLDKDVFVENVKLMFRSDVPCKANVVNRHVLHKFEQNDDGSLKLKARIALHGSEGNLKDIFILSSLLSVF